MSEMSATYKLPIGWIWTTLNELGLIVSGGTPPTTNQRFWSGEIPWITPSDLSHYKGKFIGTGKRNISGLGLEHSSARILPKNSILFSSRAPIGYVVISKNPLATNQGFKNLILAEDTYVEYLYYYLSSAKQLAESMASGTTFLELSANSFGKIPVPLPPLNEQHRIVAKIEELFSELDKTKEQLESSEKQLKLYRQSIIDLGVEGKLANGNSERRKVSASWSKVSLKDIIEEPKYGTAKKSEYNVSGHAVLRIPNIVNGVIDISDLKYAEFNQKDIESYNLKEGDLLLIRSNGSIELVGKSALVTKREEEYLYAGYLIRIRPDKQKLNSKFLLNALSSSSVKSQIESKAKSTSGVNNINSSEIKSLVIPFSTLEEQQQAVQQIENRLSVCDKVKDAILINLHKVETLRQSILKRAFTGALVKQEPSDEDAKSWLTRIKKRKIEMVENEKMTRKINSRSSKNRIMEESLKGVLELLKEFKKAMPAHQLWQSSEHKDDIDSFYAKIKELLEADQIRETARRGKESFLTYNSSK